jgi:tetratricopeptide (TPR) repeat protein
LVNDFKLELNVNTVMNKFIILLISFIFLFGTLKLQAQAGLNIHLDPKYGPDSLSRMQCANNLSTMSEFMKINLYDYALPSWREVFDKCPASSKNIYLYGVRIYRELIAREKNPSRQQELIDTLMLIYDRRIEHFGQEGLVLGRKGLDLLKYRQDKIEQAHNYFEKSIELSKNNSEEAVLVTYMQTSVVLFKNSMLENQEVIDNYLKIANILETKIDAGGQGADQAKAALNNTDLIFSESGAGSCEDLIRIFTPKFEENRDKIDLLKTITSLLTKRDCENSDLFANASENLYKIEPSAEAADNLSKLFIKREEFNKAAEYLNKAIELEENNEHKANFFYELALIEFTKFEKFSLAREHALQAADLRSSWGDPYILIGNLYAASSKICGENEFESNAVFWAAVDKYIKAKSVDPSKTEEANELINRYSQYFPNVEDAFFYGFQEGQDYTVGCWINEKTKVRTRSN